MSDEGQSRLDAVQPDGPAECEIEAHPDLLALSKRNRTARWRDWPVMALDDVITEKEWGAITTNNGDFALIIWGWRSPQGVICMGKFPTFDLAEYCANLHNQNLARRHAEQNAAKEASGTEST